MIAGRALDVASVHEVLRRTTHSAHDSLDALFGSLDLKREDDFARFLSAHHIGLRALHPAFTRFMADTLALTTPDFPTMLERDLARQGRDAATLPRLAAVQPESVAASQGIAYVVSGSRLGLAMIRKQGYWGRDEGRASDYMEDRDGLGAWRGLLAWMGGQSPSSDELALMSASATLAFDTFRQAFALSGAATAR